jgi:hypothetical protein
MRHLATVCSVSMANVLETYFESSGSDTRQSTTYDVSTINASESEFSGLATLYNVWNVLRGDAIAPDASDFATHSLAIMDSQLTISLLDVSDPNPWRFHYLRRSGAGGSNAANSMPSDLLKDIPCPMRSRALIRTCMKIRETRQPAYHEISKSNRGDVQQFMQLCLPLVTDGAVSRIILGTRKL